MKIGLDIRTIGKNRTGDETVTLQLVGNLLEMNSGDSFSLFTDEKSECKLKEIEGKFVHKENGKFEIYSVLPSKKAFWTFWSLPVFIKKFPVDILHVQYITPIWLPGKVKLITTIHDISFARYPEFIDKKDLFLLNRFIPLSLKRADKIIAVSEFTKKEIIDVYKIPEEKIEVIYNGGASKDFFSEVSEQELALFKKEHKLPKDFILYVGTLQPRKNIPFLLKSFTAFKQKFAQNESVNRLHLVIGGNRAGHNYDKKIDQVFDEIKKESPEIARQIIFSGFISNEDLPMYYKAAKTLSICSNYEGFGLPAIEAMASKTPVISTDASCMPEICSGAAVIYKHDNQDDFLEKLLLIITKESFVLELIKKGNSRAKHFNWRKNAEQTLNLYKKLK